MGSVACTFDGYTTYYGGYLPKSFTTKNNYGMQVFGTSNGVYRALIIKFTTPAFNATYQNKKITINVPLWRTSAGTDTFGLRIFTNAPSFSQSSNVELEKTYFVWNLYDIDNSNSYQMRSFTTSAADFQPNTTYYAWLYSGTPSSASITGCAGHHADTGYISVSMSYDEPTAKFYKPTDIDLYGYSGFYGGAKLQMGSNANYPYIYIWTGAGDDLNTTMTFKLGASSGKIVSVEADKTSTEKYAVITRSDTYLGESVNLSLGAIEYGAYTIPRYACQVYCNSSTPTIFTGSSGSFSPSYEGGKYDEVYFEGLASSVSSSDGNVSASWANNGAKLNGKEWYGVYTAYKCMTYYLGYDQPYEQKGSVILYGTSSETGMTIDEPSDTKCQSDDTYAFMGWTNGAFSTIAAYSTLQEAASSAAKPSTVYGVYKKDSFSVTETVNYYVGVKDQLRSTTKFVNIDASCYYGKGKYDGGDENVTYEYIDTTCPKNGWIFIGFTTDPNVQSSESSAEDLFNAGATTIYGTYYKDESMKYYYQNGKSPGEAYTTPSVRNYRYGIGDVTTKIPSEPSLEKSGYKQLGWTNSKNSSVYSKWIDLWNNETREVYAVWELTGGMWFGINGEWKFLTLYYGDGNNNKWTPFIIKYGDNNRWK